MDEIVTSRKMSSARKALLITLASFCLWASWDLLRSPSKTHAFGDRANGYFTDHFSHMNTTRLLPRAGLAIWQRPIKQMFPEYTAAERAALPEDVRGGASYVGTYKVPGWPMDKPLMSSWTHAPRNYPPGELLLFAPIAAVYHYTKLSFTWANRILILMCIAFTHAALYLFIRQYLEQPAGDGAIGFAALFVVYGAAIAWTLQGFYDMAAVAPLLVCGTMLERRRGVEAITAFCAAAFIHYRSFFLAPLVIYAAYLVVRERQWRGWGRSQRIMAGASVALSALSLYPFYLLWPWLHTAAMNNAINVWGPAVNKPAVFAFLIAWTLAAIALAWAMAWLDLAVLAWFAVMFTGLRETFPWHVLVPMAWLGVPVIAPDVRRLARARAVRLAFFLFVAVWVFRNPLMPTWMRALFR